MVDYHKQVHKLIAVLPLILFVWLNITLDQDFRKLSQKSAPEYLNVLKNP